MTWGDKYRGARAVSAGIGGLFVVSAVFLSGCGGGKSGTGEGAVIPPVLTVTSAVVTGPPAATAWVMRAPGPVTESKPQIRLGDAVEVGPDGKPVPRTSPSQP